MPRVFSTVVFNLNLPLTPGFESGFSRFLGLERRIANFFGLSVKFIHRRLLSRCVLYYKREVSCYLRNIDTLIL